MRATNPLQHASCPSFEHLLESMQAALQAVPCPMRAQPLIPVTAQSQAQQKYALVSIVMRKTCWNTHPSNTTSEAPGKALLAIAQQTTVL